MAIDGIRMGLVNDLDSSIARAGGRFLSSALMFGDYRTAHTGFSQIDDVLMIVYLFRIAGG